MILVEYAICYILLNRYVFEFNTTLIKQRYSAKDK